MHRLQAALLIACLGIPVSATAVETGSIAGGFADTQMQTNYVGEAVVVLCDAATGDPLDRNTKAPLEFTRDEHLIDRCWYATGDERGAFHFEDVPVGRYRLVAQSWSGTRGMPELMSNTSQFVYLHGAADVEVKAGEQAVAFVRQLGNGTLRITTDPEIGGSFLLLSLEPITGDPILGFSGWGPEFRRNAIGFTHMARPTVTIFGLPSDRPVHAALFAYDNSPGVGSATFAAGAREGTIPVIAAWSNGKHDPPPRLRELTAHLTREGLTIEDFIEAGGERDLNPAERKHAVDQLYAFVRTNPDRQVEVPGMDKQPLVDVLAALGYSELRIFVRK